MTAQAPAPAIAVEEMLALSSAAAVGFRCDVLASSRLLAALSEARLLERIRDALIATDQDPALAVLRSVAFHALRPAGGKLDARWWDQTRRFGERVRAGIGGVIERGDMMAMHIDGVFVLCTATSGRGLPPYLPPVAPRLLLTIADGAGLDPRGALAFIR
ncbi:MAG TPA: hypothetical protein VL463_11905 [Kofleriaceae bacterium]|nr:hypothetical protein [Kofleriaceae bacterium]